MQELTVKDILKILKKRWLAIVIFCAFVTAAAAIYFWSLPNEYTAQATLYVKMVYEDSQNQLRFDTAVSTQFVGDFKELISNQTVMDRTIQALGISQKEFDDVSIDVSSETGTRILSISATSRDKGLSVKVANTVSKIFTDYIQDLMTTNTAANAEKAVIPDAGTNVEEVVMPNVVTIASEAVTPVNPSGPDRMKNTALAGVIGLLLAVGVALAMEMLNTTLRTSTAIESTLGLPVLASIQNYRKEIVQFLQKHQRGEMLSSSVSVATKENINTLVANIQFATIAQPIQTLIVTSSVAGEGKSSMLLLLSEALADLNKRVLLVDMDMRNASLWKYAGSRGKKDLFDYLVGHSRLEDVICKTGNPGIHFIDSRHHLASVSQIVHFEVFERFLDNVKRTYDYVLFDTPPLSMFIDAAALANKMDAVLLVVGNGMTDAKIAADVVNQLHKANANVLGVALNFVDDHKGHAEYYGRSFATDKKGQAVPPKMPGKEM